MRVRGDEIEVDLTGTADQVADRPINMPFEGTVDVAVWLTVRSVLLDTAVCGHIPVNDGLLRPIKITAPLGSLANPVFPAPTIARFCPGNQVADTVMKALAQALPGQVSAGIGNLKVIAFSGMRQGKHWVHMEIFEGSYGGRGGLDGMDAVDTLYANTRNNPIEDIESHLPLRVSRYELREGVSGAGEWRGGLGSVREFAYLSDGGASVEGEGHEFAPWGFAGGEPGHPAELRLVRRDGTVEMLPSKVPHMQIRAGERFVCIGPAGGGYGDPLRARTGAGARRCRRWFASGGGGSPRIRCCAYLCGRSSRGGDGSPAFRDDQRADRPNRIGLVGRLYAAHDLRTGTKSALLRIAQQGGEGCVIIAALARCRSTGVLFCAAARLRGPSP